MNDSNFNQQESIALITEMINRTKDRLHIGDGNILLLYGYLSVAITITVWTLVTITAHPAWNFLFFLIWIIGGTVSPHLSHKQEEKYGTTYIDKISNGIWKVVGYSAIIATLTCLAFLFIGGKDTWSLMAVFALIIVSFAEITQGIIINEKSLIIGAAIGMLCGIITTAAIAGKVALTANIFCPIFIIAFTAMMILPGHILNNKARRQCSQN